MTEGHEESVNPTVERIARESYGRLIAYLASRTRDVAAAEDALSDTFIAALSTWPRDGIPLNPEAWLLTTSRRSLIDRIRHQQVILSSQPTLLLLKENSIPSHKEMSFPDDRLKLLFVCAHPAIDPAMHTPLMLQTVLGLDASRIAGPFLIAPKTMGQRLVRAKTKILRGGIRFEIPQRQDLPGRLDSVLEAIYAAFGIGWDDMLGADERGRGLAEEAIWLARVLLHLMPREPEVHGLLALMLHCEARRAARRGSNGEYIPLSEQDPRHWSLSLIVEAERHLVQAASYERPRRFQLEAAIQSVHSERVRGCQIAWEANAQFYEQLVGILPTVGVRTGYAAAIAETSGPEKALSVLDTIEPDLVSSYQPYWAVRAHMLQRLKKRSEAHEAFNRAIGLSQDPAAREFLLRRRG